MRRKRLAALISGTIAAATIASMPILGVASIMIPIVTVTVLMVVAFGIGWWRGVWSPTRGVIRPPRRDA